MGHEDEFFALLLKTLQDTTRVIEKSDNRISKLESSFVDLRRSIEALRETIVAQNAIESDREKRKSQFWKMADRFSTSTPASLILRILIILTLGGNIAGMAFPELRGSTHVPANIRPLPDSNAAIPADSDR